MIRATLLSVATLLAIAVFGMARVSQATSVVNYNSIVTAAGTTVVPYVVATNDLLQSPQLASTASTGDFTFMGGDPGVSVLTDGAFLDAGPQFSQTALTNSGNTLTYTFASPLGETISGITTYSGWDQFLGGQNYTVAYDTVSDKGDYHTIASAQIDLDGVNGWGSSRVQLTDTTGVIAYGVNSLMFTFGAVNRGPAGFREIDVFGAPTPEPSSIVLCGLGAVGLLFAARRRRSAKTI